ncbi:hypothetical protein HDV00_006957 [Rhizophlyctis rosea]|nr:hypothetical protein HDV00_006957 [Rhizophlyctis rosea]
MPSSTVIPEDPHFVNALATFNEESLANPNYGESSLVQVCRYTPKLPGAKQATLVIPKDLSQNKKAKLRKRLIQRMNEILKENGHPEVQIDHHNIVASNDAETWLAAVKERMAEKGDGGTTGWPHVKSEVRREPATVD